MKKFLLRWEKKPQVMELMGTCAGVMAVGNPCVVGVMEILLRIVLMGVAATIAGQEKPQKGMDTVATTDATVKFL